MRLHYWGSVDYTACGRKILTGADWAQGDDPKFATIDSRVTEDPRQVTCKRCLGTQPSAMER